MNLQLLVIIFRKIILLWGKPKDISINGITDIPYKKSMDELSSDTHLPLDNFVATEAFLTKSLEY